VCCLLSKTPKERSDADLTIKVTLGKDEIFSGGLKISFQDKNRTRIVAGLPPLVLSAPGNLNVALHTKRALLGTWTIKVNQLPGPSATASPAGNLPSASITASKSKPQKRRRKASR
jgi:hypothetical protein